MPNALNTAEALTELCRRDYETIFQYLLSLPFTHSHRHFMLSCLRPRIMRMKVADIKRLSIWIPNLSALWYIPDTREWLPVMGPSTDLETGMWDTRLVLSAPSCKTDGRSVHSLGLRPVFKHFYLHHVMFFLDVNYLVMEWTVFPPLDSPEPKPLILY